VCRRLRKAACIAKTPICARVCPADAIKRLPTVWYIVRPEASLPDDPYDVALMLENV